MPVKARVQLSQQSTTATKTPRPTHAVSLTSEAAGKWETTKVPLQGVSPRCSLSPAYCFNHSSMKQHGILYLFVSSLTLDQASASQHYSYLKF